MKISDANYYVVHGWMITRMGLKGVDLQLYAIIYGFTQDGESEFAGSIQYLCDFCGGVTRPTVSASLKRLTDNGLLEKIPQTINGVTFNRYRASEKFLQGVKNFYGGGEKNFTGGDKKILHNNKDNIDIDKSDKEDILKSVIESWNALPDCIPKVQKLEKGSTRLKKALALISDYEDKDINAALENVRKSDFLLGKTGNGWRITFDWFVQKSNFQKVLEGNYNNRGPAETERPASYNIQKAMDDMRYSVPKLKKRGGSS